MNHGTTDRPRAAAGSHRRGPLTSALLALLLVAPALSPELAADPGESFDGSFLVGFRSVDVGGAERKYLEDVTLEDGPRLFELELRYAPAESEAVDRVLLDVGHFGGDPYETLAFSVEKYGAYDLRYDRRSSDYFYDDLILPHDLADVRLSSGGDFHTFDLRRVHDSARLDIDLGRRASAFFGFDRFTRRGESTTTLDISRDEFELDRPIDESLDDYRGGFDYRWRKVTFSLEERYRVFDDQASLFLPGFSEGENTSPNSASLDFYFFDQPYEAKSHEHVGRVVVRPNRRVTLRASLLVQDLELELDATERAQGITFNGQPFSSEATGASEIERDGALADLDLVVRVSPRLAWTTRVWNRALDQDGESLLLDGELGLGGWEIDATGVESGVQLQATPALSVAGGLRYETREVESGFTESAASPADLVTTSEETDHTGFFALLGWRPRPSCSLTLQLEDSSYDDPYTLVSPTGHQRLRLNARWRLTGGWTLSGSYLLRRVDNDDSGWSGDSDQLGLRLAYARPDLDLSLGFNRVELDRRIDQVVVTLPGFGGGQRLPFPIDYRAEADFFDARLRWRPSGAWTFGGDLRLYANDGSFALERDDVGAFVEHAFPAGYLLRAGYRTLDYDEQRFDFDDYDAEIFELAVGYRW